MNVDYEIIQLLVDLRTELQILNQQVRNGVLTDEAILAILKSANAPATKFTIVQSQSGGTMAGITGTQVGGTSTFQAVPNGALQAGAPVVWSSSDPAITLTPVATDPTGLTVQAVDTTGDTNASYTLTVTGTSSNGSSITGTAQVPLLPTPATAFTINQLS